MNNLRDLMIEAIMEDGGGFQRKYSKKKSSYVPGNSNGKICLSYCELSTARSKKTGETKEFIAAHLSHVWEDGAVTLANAINSSVPVHIISAYTTKAPGKNRVFMLRINIAYKDELPNVIDKLRDAINSTHDYNATSVNTLCNNLLLRVDSVVTSDDEADMAQNISSTWLDILKKLNDPAVRETLLKYQMSNDYARAYGHQLSENNVVSILSQFPNASFVAEKYTWEKLFNRKVMPGARRIVVWVPLNSEQVRSRDDSARAMGFQDYKHAMSVTNNSTQVKGKINIGTKMDPSKFRRAIMYDVSQTIPPSNPKKDKWTLEIGLSDNLRGEMNAVTQELDKNLSGEDKEKIERNKQRISQAQQMKNVNRKNALLALCRKMKIDTAQFENLSDEEFIPRASYEYAVANMPKYGIIRPENIEKMASMCAICVAVACGIDTLPRRYTKILDPAFIEREKRNKRFDYTPTQEDAMTVASLVKKIFPSILAATKAQKIEKVVESMSRRHVFEGRKKPVTLGWLKKFFRNEFGDGTETTVESKGRIDKIVSEEIRKFIGTRG